MTVDTSSVAARSISVTDGSIVFLTNGSALFAETVSLSLGDHSDLAIAYGQPTSENPGCFSFSRPCLHFGAILGVPEREALRWWVLSASYTWRF
jgi:hypothetical protein